MMSDIPGDIHIRTCIDRGLEGHQLHGVDPRPGEGDARQGGMAVHHGGAVAREVLEAGQDPGGLQPIEEGGDEEEEAE